MKDDRERINAELRVLKDDILASLHKYIRTIERLPCFTECPFIQEVEQTGTCSKNCPYLPLYTEFSRFLNTLENLISDYL